MSCRMAIQVEMFGVRPSGKPTKPKLVESGVPLRTPEKAPLIDEYIHRFLLATKHGGYLGPKKLVLQHMERFLNKLARQRRELPWSSQSTAATDYTLQQLAPYIGRMKTSIARSLVLNHTNEGDLVVDPFCGSGVVALEAAAAAKRIVAGDWNPYAILLTRAKLFAPTSLPVAKKKLQSTWLLSRKKLCQQDIRKVPKWVREFFHAETLRNALAFRDSCIEHREHFLLACLLGVLHHERPGFLSKPSSHLVPYLRNRKYPQDLYPGMYEPRDVLERLEAKIIRAFRRPIGPYTCKRKVVAGDARVFPRIRKINAVITSPPYMNELDYVRDNRLRLWFLLRSLPTGLDLVHRDRVTAFKTLLTSVCTRLAGSIVVGGTFVLVVGDATRGNGSPGRTAVVTEELFATDRRLRNFRLHEVCEDIIPDIRRSRRECRGTKCETVFTFRKLEDL